MEEDSDERAGGWRVEVPLEVAEKCLFHRLDFLGCEDSSGEVNEIGLKK
jgi:hypothetical protein